MKTRRVRRMFCGVLALLSLVACGGNSAQSYSRTRPIRDFWVYQEGLIEQMPHRVFDTPWGGFDPRFYPGAPAYTFLSAWSLLHDLRYLQSAQRQLTYAHSRENADHLVLFPDNSYIGRMAQAQQILSYYVAYRTTSDLTYLHWADDALAALRKLRQADVFWKGRTYKLYYYLYYPQPPYDPTSTSMRIDPNQEANIGSVMTLLYHTPKSVFYLNSDLAAQAHMELDAAIALEDAQGRVPLTQNNLDQFDTGYGGWALMFVYWANTFWHDARYDDALRRGAAWLDQYSVGGILVHYYPTYVTGSATSPTQLWYRLPLIAHYGGNLNALQDALDATCNRLHEFTGPSGGWSTPVVMQEAMGVNQNIGRW